MKILVTGASGFIGSFLVKDLSKSNKVTAFVRKSSNIEGLKIKNVRIVQGNLLDVNSLKKASRNADVVIHCAALHGDYSYKEMYDVNVTGTMNVLDACLYNKVKKFIHISTAAFFSKGENIDEKTKPSPYNDYGKTKLESENLAKEYMKKMNVIILRPTVVYGPSEKANTIKWFRYIKKGYFRIFGSGNNFTDMLYIDDLIEAVNLAIKTKIKNQVYLIAGFPCTMSQFTGIIAKAEKVKSPKHIPLWISYVAGFFIGILSSIFRFDAPISITKVRNMTRSRSFNAIKAEKELKFKAKTTIENGIEKTSACLGLLK